MQYAGDEWLPGSWGRSRAAKDLKEPFKVASESIFENMKPDA
jgi:hypothetical protein